MDYNSVIDELKFIIENINLEYLNISIIDENVQYLYNIYLQIKKEYSVFSSMDFPIENIKSGPIYDKVVENISYISLPEKEKDILKEKVKSINKLEYGNTFLFWISFDDEKDDSQYAFKMFKIFLCLQNFYKPSKDEYKNRIVVWFPIDSKRDFYFDKINEDTLLYSKKKFGAFVASGLTTINNNFFYPIRNLSRITIITRYEEIEKLLIHELIHNFNMDGNEYLTDLNSIITKYNSIKPNNNYTYDFSIFESYVELSSTYFYLIFKNINEDVENVKDKLFSQIVIEIIYSYNIIANLIKLNEYDNYEKFKETIKFKGEIPFYEYYYIKALMYNNYIFKLGYKLKDFINIYENIIYLIKKNIKNDDKLMKEIYSHSHKNFINFKYQIH
jgi:hypothetical protein